MILIPPAGRQWDSVAPRGVPGPSPPLMPRMPEPTPIRDFAKCLFRSLYEELQALDQRILAMEAEVHQAFQQSPLCPRIAEIEGAEAQIPSGPRVMTLNFDAGYMYAVFLKALD